MKQIRHIFKALPFAIICAAAVIIVTCGELYAQSYEFTINTRRCYDKITAELWARRVSGVAPKLGHSTLMLTYNSAKLTPSAAQTPAQTDSVSGDYSLANPVVAINSPFNGANGFTALTTQAYGSGFFALELNLANLGTGGYTCDSVGRGTFLGALSFTITNNPDTGSLMQIAWSNSTAPGISVVSDINGSDIKSQINFVNPLDEKIIGIKILAPVADGFVIDRDKAYPQLTGGYAGVGFPIYYERSVNPGQYPAPIGQTGINENVGFAAYYSLDNGSVWTEFGRFAETDKASSGLQTSSFYKSGEIAAPAASSCMLITSQDGSKLNSSNYTKPIRVIWQKNQYFSSRSEQARMKLAFLDGAITQPIAARSVNNTQYTEPGKLILGRIFFLQLGGHQYMRTRDNFSNSTQLTVEAWVNLNAFANSSGTANIPPAIVASSGGPGAGTVLGSTEGAWMLYLKNGKIPSFRVRELLGRGTGGYLADISSSAQDTMTLITDSLPLVSDHAKNWIHLAATVDDNDVKLYVNGDLSAEYTNTAANDIRMLPTNHPIWIGVNPNTAIDTTRMIRAGIKNVRIWRNALTQSEIRARACGISAPSDFSGLNDPKRGLELCYSFEGTTNDEAKDTVSQNGMQPLLYYIDSTLQTVSPRFRPDVPHIKIISPSMGAGVTNLQYNKYPVRWISCGVGDFSVTPTKDVEIEYSLDGGTSWFLCKDSLSADLGGTSSIDAEGAVAYWYPYNNTAAGASLRTITPYWRTTIVRVKGGTNYSQSGIYDISAPFTVAPYFSLKIDTGSVVMINPNQKLNITGTSAYIEARIRPYRFPTETEGFFPILEKVDTASQKGHYSLRLLPTGQLMLVLTDTSGSDRTFTSDSTVTVERPNSMSLDSVWTSVGVYVNLNDSKTKPDIKFYIDGTPLNALDTASNAVKLNATNLYPLYVGCVPAYSEKILIPDPQNAGAFTTQTNAVTAHGFSGEIREIGIWSGTPGKASPAGTEPTPMTSFIQGSSVIPLASLSQGTSDNLSVNFSLSGGTLADGGIVRNISSTGTAGLNASYYGTRPSYMPVEPYLKLVEPHFRQSVANSASDVRVRWTGFAYKGDGFTGGSSSPLLPPSLEYSVRTSSGSSVQLYTYVASLYWRGNAKNSFTLPVTSDSKISLGTNKDMWFSGKLDISTADPDYYNDGTNRQGMLSAALTNARLRLGGSYSIFGETRSLKSEGPLFTITPASNFTIRVLLEGRHNGSTGGKLMRNIGTSYATGGLKIKLFADNNGAPGAVLDSAESASGYAELNPANRNSGTNRFGNVNFIFTDKYDGSYWIGVYHLNHLPVMSRFPAPFLYAGDDLSTWKIESGWDFESWNGTDNNVLKSVGVDPWNGNFFTAYGNAVSDKQASPSTALIFNNGLSGLSTSAMPAMIGGDVNSDGVINARDRADVRLDDGTSKFTSDVTGDGIVNADDRTIVDRNTGRYSSLGGTTAAKTAPVTDLTGYDNPRLRDPETEAIGHIFDYFKPLAVSESLKKQLTKSGNEIQYASAVAVNVYAEPSYNSTSKTVDLDFYAENLADSAALANCTFAVSYNSSLLSFVGLKQKSKVIFSSNATAGYAALRTAPAGTATSILPDMRTVEIDYDAAANPGGIALPYSKTYLGTLTYSLKSDVECIKFDYHSATSLHTVKNGNITEYCTFKPINPIILYTALVTAPTGGVSLLPKKTTAVTWTSSGKSPVYLEYSTDGGSSWSRINSVAVTADSKSYPWQTPDTYSVSCFVRIIDSATQSEVARSKSAFSIMPGYVGITKPFPGDIYYPSIKSVDTVTWSQNGYTKFIAQISTDGGASWNIVTPSAVATSSRAAWKIPKVTTKNAVIRLLDFDDSTEVARSESFTVITGAVVFRNPAKNEKFLTGRAGWINWTAYDVSKFDLEISLDAGATAESIATDVDAGSKRFAWTPREDQNSGYAVVTALLGGDPDLPLGKSGEFTIYTVNDVSENEPEGLRIGFPKPNPASSSVSIQFEAKNSSEVSVKVFNVLGQCVAQTEKYVNAGTDEVRFSADDLPAGRYEIIIFGKGFTVRREFVTVK